MQMVNQSNRLIYQRDHSSNDLIIYFWNSYIVYHMSFLVHTKGPNHNWQDIWLFLWEGPNHTADCPGTLFSALAFLSQEFTGETPTFHDCPFPGCVMNSSFSFPSNLIFLVSLDIPYKFLWLRTSLLVFQVFYIIQINFIFCHYQRFAVRGRRLEHDLGQESPNFLYKRPNNKCFPGQIDYATPTWLCFCSAKAPRDNK